MTFMKYSITLLIINILTIINTSKAQEGRLNMQVVDKASNAIANVKVSIYKNDTVVKEIWLDGDGMLNTNLLTGYYKVTKLETVRDSVFIQANQAKYIYPVVDFYAPVGSGNKSIHKGKSSFLSKSGDKPKATISAPAVAADYELGGEVVVTSYGSRAKRDVTGSIATVTTKSMAKELHSLKETDKKTPIEKISAGLLTATEVNDFNKWQLWDDLAENEFKSFTELWKMKPAKRYALVVQNEERYPLANINVSLIADNGKIIWQTKTDNTGRAELWEAINDNDVLNYKTASIEITTNGIVKKINNPTLFDVQGVNFITIQQACTISNEVDVLFAVDATGSMGDEIKYLQAEFTDIVQKVQSTHKGINLRLGSVFYRDINDAYVTRHVPFSNDVMQTLDFMNAQLAGGGGDYPEALDSALAVALHQYDWNPNARTRILFLVLDAPAHDYAVSNLQQLAKLAATMGVRIIPIAASGVDKSTEYLLRTLALSTNGTYVALTNHSGIGNNHITPTTNEIKVETLSDAMQRIIKQFLFVSSCITKPEDKTPFTAVPPQYLTDSTSVSVTNIKLFPNPCTTMLQVDVTKGSIKEFFVTDLHGRILYRITASKKITTIDVSRLPAASYILMYNNGKRLVGEQFIVVK
jgi:hypothetical protein